MTRKSELEFLTPGNQGLYWSLKRARTGDISSNDIVFFFRPYDNTDFVSLCEAVDLIEDDLWDTH